ncbi:MAG: plastocyanin/azurin family copper-binding protein [Patescibacteria group bacterium]
MNARGKWLVIGVIVLVTVGGGVLLLRNTNPKSQIPSSNEIGGQPDLQVPVTEEAVTPEVKVETTGKTVEVAVEGSQFKFLPATIKAKKGDTVVVIFKSMGGMHDFMIDEFEVATNQIGDGEEEEMEFVADKIGTFEYYCSVDGHRQLGMVGKLIVE